MPMNSYTSIFNYLSKYILPYLKDVETENRIYFSAAQNDTRKLDIARNIINHNKSTMNTIEKNKQELLVELQNVSLLVSAKETFCDAKHLLSWVSKMVKKSAFYSLMLIRCLTGDFECFFFYFGFGLISK